MREFQKLPAFFFCGRSQEAKLWQLAIL